MSFFHNNALAGASGQTTGGDDAYQVERSLRFNKTDTAYMQRTFGAGNQRTYTWSGWVKRGEITTPYHCFFSSADGSSPNGRTSWQFQNNILNIGFNPTGSSWVEVKTSQYFRDSSAWMHLVIAVDTSQAENTDRVKVYVNGKKVTVFDNYPTITQNLQTHINKAKEHSIGRYENSDSDYYDGLISNVQFIDGLQLSAAAFGSFDSTGVWNPKAFALPAPNTNKTWSGMLTGLDDGSAETVTTPTKAFDGVPAGNDYAKVGASGSGTNPTLIFTPSSAIENVNELVAVVHAGGSGSESYVQVNDGDWINIYDKSTSSPYYFDLTEYIGSDRKLTKLATKRTGSTSAGWGPAFYSIHINGVQLVDGKTDPTTRTNPNDGTTWSDNLTASGGFHAWYPANEAFNGVVTSAGRAEASSADVPIVWTGSIVVNNTLSIWSGKSAFKYQINNSGSYTSVTDHSEKWKDIAFSGTLTDLKIMHNTSGEKAGYSGIKIDGGLLVDSTVDNSFHLKFNDTSLNRYLGKDTLNGKIADATGGLPIYNTTDDYGDVKGSGTRTDSDSSNLKLAIAGDAFTDSSGNSVNVSATNATISTAESRFYGSSINFDVSSTNQHVTTAGSLWSANGDHTFEAWLWVNDFNQQRTIFHTTGPGDFAVHSTGAIRIHPDGNHYQDTSNKLAVQQWYHVALVQGSNFRKIYVNGVDWGFDSAVGSPQSQAWNNPTGTMEIGDDGQRYFFSGYMQDIRVYDKQKYTANFKPPTRNDFTVNNLTHNDGGVVIGSSTGGIPILTTTDNPNYGETTGGSVDTSDANKSDIILAISGYSAIADVHHTVKGSGSALTLSAGGSGADPAISTTSSRLYGNSIYFAGANHIKVPHSSTFQFGSGSSGSTSNDFTWEFWMNPSSVSGLRGIVGGRGDGGGNNGALLMLAHASLQLNYPNNDPGLNYEGVQVGTWYHVAISRNENNLRLFVNGNLIETITGTDTIDLYPSSSHWYIGDSNYGSGTSLGPYQGYIQDFRMYTTAKYTSSFTVPTLPVPENIDSLVDSPTNYAPADGSDATGGVTRGNFCTVNPLTNQDWGYGDWTVSNGNLTAEADDGTSNRIGCTMGASTGKWYWEVETEYNSGTGAIGIGINGANTDYHADWNTGDYAVYLTGHNNNGSKHRAGSSTDWGDEIADGDVIGVQWDADNGSIYFWRNGVIQESGAAAFTGLSGLYVPCGISTSSVQNNTLHFNFGQRAFKYTNAGTNRPSADYKCLCTQNLDDTFKDEAAEIVNNPSKYFGILEYTGTAAVNTIRGLNFQPELIWIKNKAGSTSHSIYDTARGQGSNGYYRIEADTDDAQADEANLTAITSDGFTLTSSGGYTNGSGANYVSWCWDCGAAAVTPSSSYDITPDAQWVNATAGFSITKYEGNGTADQRIPHGQSVKPDWAIIKKISSSGNDGSWMTKHVGLSADRIVTLDNPEAQNTDSSWYGIFKDHPDQLTVKVSTNNDNRHTNEDGAKYILYAWAPISGYSSFGSYEGGADPAFIYTGMRPKFVIIKCRSHTDSWVLYDGVRNKYNVIDDFLQANNDEAEATGNSNKIDILSNGFAIRGAQVGTAGAGKDYIYCAFAESPFKTSRAR